MKPAKVESRTTPHAESQEIETFIRIKRHPLKPGDHFEAFQPEVIRVQGTRIVERRLVSKPDVFEMAFALAADLVDPRNTDAILTSAI